MGSLEIEIIGGRVPFKWNSACMVQKGGNDVTNVISPWCPAGTDITRTSVIEFIPLKSYEGNHCGDTTSLGERQLGK